MKMLFFEDVSVGADIPKLVIGPLSTTHLMRWSAAIENWHKIHYDRQFAIEHDRLPGLLVNGSLKQQFVLKLLKEWIGPGGWVWKVNFQFRAMNIAGEELSVWANIAEKSRAAEYGLVHLKLGIINDAGKESTPGNAIVALPYRDGPPLPYPFIPPS